MTGSITYRLIKKIKEDIRTSLIIGFVFSCLSTFIKQLKASFLLGRFLNPNDFNLKEKEVRNNFLVRFVQWIFRKLHRIYVTVTKGSFSVNVIHRIFTLELDLVFTYISVLVFYLLNLRVIYDLFNYNTQFILLSITAIVDGLVLISYVLPMDYSSRIITSINQFRQNIKGRNVFTILISAIFFLISLSIGFYKVMAVLLGLIVVYFIFRYFKIGIYLLAISIPFLPDQLTIVILLLSVISGFVHWIIKEDFEIDINGYNTVFILMLIVFTINTVLSVNVSGSMRDLVINGLSILMIIHLINGIEKKKDLYTLIDFIIVIGFMTAFYAFYQYFSGEPMGSGWVDPSSNISIRVFSTFENPNLYAEYLIMIIPLTFARILSVDGKKKIIHVFIGMTLLVALLLTFSRGGWLGLVFAIGVLVLLLKKDLIIKLIPVGIVGMFFLPNSIMMRIKSIGSLSDSSNFYRFQIWENSINIIKDFFVTGVGLGFESFRSISSLYIKDFSPYHAHNTYLELMIEVGVLGLILFIWLLGKLLKDIRYQKISQDKIFTVALFSGIAGLFIHGVAEHILYNPKIIFQFWLITGLLITFNVKFMKVRENNEYINDH
jgi:O-antigen ligase